eukprot:6204003-Pleurochrysis_carterae.AAC.6
MPRAQQGPAGKMGRFLKTQNVVFTGVDTGKGPRAASSGLRAYLNQPPLASVRTGSRRRRRQGQRSRRAKLQRQRQNLPMAIAADSLTVSRRQLRKQHTIASVTNSQAAQRHKQHKVASSTDSRAAQRHKQQRLASSADGHGQSLLGKCVSRFVPPADARACAARSVTGGAPPATDISESAACTFCETASTSASCSVGASPAADVPHCTSLVDCLHTLLAGRVGLRCKGALLMGVGTFSGVATNTSDRSAAIQRQHIEGELAAFFGAIGAVWRADCVDCADTSES